MKNNIPHTYFSIITLFIALFCSHFLHAQVSPKKKPSKVIEAESKKAIKKKDGVPTSVIKKPNNSLVKKIAKIPSIEELEKPSEKKQITKRVTIRRKKRIVKKDTVIKKKLPRVRIVKKRLKKEVKKDTTTPPISVKKHKINTPVNAGKWKKQIDTIPYLRSGNILTKFIKPVIHLKEGDIISNVLKVVNLSSKDIPFVTDLLYPAGWTRIDDPHKIYIAKAKDTIIVPVIISPTKLVNGNTEILINAFLIGSSEQQLANNYFSLKTKKKVSWMLNLGNSQSIYFKNDEDTKRLDFEVTNTGNYKQDLFINYSIPRKNLVLLDTLGNLIAKPSLTFSLEAGEKKDFNYLVKAQNLNRRNFKRISLNTYSPIKNSEKKVHPLIINSSEPKTSEISLQKRTKINFVKLPNQTQISPFGYPYLPLTVELAAQNVLDDRSFLSLNLRGFKQISPTANLLYSTQLNYSNAFYTNNVFKNAPWYIGYFDSKKTFEIGQISGNLVGISNSGQGIKGSYKLSKNHSFGIFYVNSLGFFESKSSTTLGGWYKYFYNNHFKITARFGSNNNIISNRKISMISLHPSLTVFKKHHFSITTAFTKKDQENRPSRFKSNGYLFGTTYSSYFLKKKLKTNFSVRVNDKNFSFGNFDRLVLNQRTHYTFNNKWNAFFSSNYQNLKSYSYYTKTKEPIFKQELFYNSLVFSNHADSGTYQPGLYYEYRNVPYNVFHSRGITFRYSNFNFSKNFVSSLYTKIGYTKPIDPNKKTKDYFTLEISSLLRYRTWSLTSRYNLGAFSSLTAQNSVNSLITPQSLRISLQNQYLFENRHFAVETSGVYTYNNIFRNHTVGLFPVAYYFTNTGWRFGISANYIYTTSDFSSIFDITDTTANPNLNNLGPTVTSNFNLNFNLRKNFGIPIPFTKKTAATKTFVSFLDLNGNHIKDDNESTLQNVVIRVNRHEILTNVEGKAIVKNLPNKKYKLEVFSLEKLKGWFPNVSDSIYIDKEDGNTYIPFVRGVKVYGDVVLDRQKIAVADNKTVDLGRIKISATKGDKIYHTLTNKNGRFEFYLPFGDYIITMDEGILNSRFHITRNNIPLQLKNSQDGVYTSFYIVEKRRKVIFKDFSKKKKKSKK